MKPLLVHAVTSLIVTSVALAGYHRFVVEPAHRVAVVNIEAIATERQDILTDDLIHARTDQERAAVHSRAKAFAQQMQRAVEELAVECDCLVLDRTVLVGVRADTVDLTPQLRKKVSR